MSVIKTLNNKRVGFSVTFYAVLDTAGMSDLCKTLHAITGKQKNITHSCFLFFFNNVMILYITIYSMLQ